MALEARELYGRPNCNSCSPKLRRERGCFKPGHKELEGAGMESTVAWRFSSPMIPEKEAIIRECPVGRVMRESPDVYAAIELEAYGEVGAFDPLKLSPWMAAGVRTASNERGRLWQVKEDRRKAESQAKSDAAHAKNQVRRR